MMLIRLKNCIYITPGDVHQAITLSNEKSNQNNEVYESIHVVEKSRRTNIFKMRISKIGDNLKAMDTNADQFLNKKEDLLEITAGNEPSIVMITEVIPKAQINLIEASALNIDGYDVYVNFDITKPNLGACGIRGVAIYVKDELNASEVTFCAEFNDHIWVEIPLTEKHSLLCRCIYRSPIKEKDITLKST